MLKKNNKITHLADGLGYLNNHKELDAIHPTTNKVIYRVIKNNEYYTLFMVTLGTYLNKLTKRMIMSIINKDEIKYNYKVN